jgi:hypothetical protein
MLRKKRKRQKKLQADISQVLVVTKMRLSTHAQHDLQVQRQQNWSLKAQVQSAREIHSNSRKTRPCLLAFKQTDQNALYPEIRAVWYLPWIYLRLDNFHDNP